MAHSAASKTGGARGLGRERVGLGREGGGLGLVAPERVGRRGGLGLGFVGREHNRLGRVVLRRLRGRGEGVGLDPLGLVAAQELAFELAQLGLELSERPACVVVRRGGHAERERSAPGGRLRPRLGP